MKTIIVATDFSSCAKNAAAYAAEMALAINAGLHILHIYEIPVVYMEIPVAMTDGELTASAELAMNKLKESLILKTGNKLSISSEIITGRFFTELDSVCEKIKPYSVVIGSQGTTAAERLFFGGHAVYAMKYLGWPLITVPQGAKFSAIRKIGLACDFDNIAETVPVEEIEAVVKDFHASLHVLNTAKQHEYNTDVVYEAGVLREKLKELRPEYHFLNNVNDEKGIMDFAEKNQLDLLVIIPKRHDLLDKIFYKSHTKQLVLHSHVPLMALHY